jgi:hypothetical protein
MIDDFRHPLWWWEITLDPPVRLAATASVDYRHIYAVVRGKIAEVTTLPCGCSDVAEMLRACGWAPNSVVYDLGRHIHFDVGIPH